MKRAVITIIVVIAGIALSFLMVTAGTAIALRTTSWGRLMTGQSISDPWAAFESGFRVLVVYIALPTVLTVGFLVGKFARRYPVLAAIVAVIPVSVVASGMAIEWVTLVLIACGVAAGYAPLWWRSRFDRQSAVEAG